MNEYVRSLYELGLRELESGNEKRAAELLTDFLKHWGDADWDLPEVAGAKKRLARSE